MHRSDQAHHVLERIAAHVVASRHAAHPNPNGMVTIMIPHIRVSDRPLRAYPNNPAARTAIMPQAKRFQFFG